MCDGEEWNGTQQPTREGLGSGKDPSDRVLVGSPLTLETKSRLPLIFHSFCFSDPSPFYSASRIPTSERKVCEKCLCDLKGEGIDPNSQHGAEPWGSYAYHKNGILEEQTSGKANQAKTQTQLLGGVGTTRSK